MMSGNTLQFQEVSAMTLGRFLVPVNRVIVGVFAALCVTSTGAIAQEHNHGSNGKADASALVQAVREATARFKDVGVAENEEYHLMFGCVSGPDVGAMGLHYVNMSLVMDGELDPAHPEIIL